MSSGPSQPSQDVNAPTAVQSFLANTNGWGNWLLEIQFMGYLISGQGLVDQEIPVQYKIIPDAIPRVERSKFLTPDEIYQESWTRIYPGYLRYCETDSWPPLVLSHTNPYNRGISHYPPLAPNAETGPRADSQPSLFSLAALLNASHDAHKKGKAEDAAYTTIYKGPGYKEPQIPLVYRPPPPHFNTSHQTKFSALPGYCAPCARIAQIARRKPFAVAQRSSLGFHVDDEGNFLSPYVPDDNQTSTMSMESQATEIARAWAGL